MAAELWYYTAEGRQMDPVSMSELKQLVGNGTLKPTDMIWKEGLPRWIRASTLKELFPDPTAALDKYFTSTPEAEKRATASPASTAPIVVSAKSGGADDSARPHRRRHQPKSGGGNFGVIIALVFLGMLVVGGLFGGVVLMMFIFRPGDQKPPTEEKKDKPFIPIEGEQKHDFKIGPGETKEKTFPLRNGVSYDIRVNVKEPLDAGARAGIIIYDASSGARLASFLNPKSRNYLERWTPQQDGNYRIDIENKAVGKEMKATISLVPTDQAGGKEGDPLPKDVRDGSGSLRTEDLKPGQSRTYKFRVQGGYKASFSLTVQSADKKASKFNLFVAKEHDANELIKSDITTKTHARVDFTIAETEIVLVRVENASKTVTNSGSITFNVSPDP